MKSKADSRPRFSQKSNKRFFLPRRAKKQKKTHKFVHSFFGRIYKAPICFRFYLTFIKKEEGQQETPEMDPLWRKSIWCFSTKVFKKATQLLKKKFSKKTTLYLALQTCFYFFVLLMVTFFLAAKWKLNHISHHLSARGYTDGWKHAAQSAHSFC